MVAEEHVKAENERYKQQNCAGLSSDACSVKMYKERREHLKDTLSTGADFVPVIGDIKSYAEAESALDYLAATIGVVPGVGDAAGKAIKAADTALKRRDLAEASRLINETSQHIASGAKDGVGGGFSGGKPTVSDDPYNPSAVTDRSKVNRDYYGLENAADEFSAGLPNYATHSTAKSYQSTAPRDLNEQTLWNRVIENPLLAVIQN